MDWSLKLICEDFFIILYAAKCKTCYKTAFDLAKVPKVGIDEEPRLSLNLCSSLLVLVMTEIWLPDFFSFVSALRF